MVIEDRMTESAFVDACADLMESRDVDESIWLFVAAVADLGLAEGCRQFPAGALNLTYAYRHFWPLESQPQLEPLAQSLRLRAFAELELIELTPTPQEASAL